MIKDSSFTEGEYKDLVEHFKNICNSQNRVKRREKMELDIKNLREEFFKNDEKNILLVASMFLNNYIYVSDGATIIYLYVKDIQYHSNNNACIFIGTGIIKNYDNSVIMSTNSTDISFMYKNHFGIDIIYKDDYINGIKELLSEFTLFENFINDIKYIEENKKTFDKLKVNDIIYEVQINYNNYDVNVSKLKITDVKYINEEKEEIDSYLNLYNNKKVNKIYLTLDNDNILKLNINPKDMISSYNKTELLPGHGTLNYYTTVYDDTIYYVDCLFEDIIKHNEKEMNKIQTKHNELIIKRKNIIDELTKIKQENK